MMGSHERSVAALLAVNNFSRVQGFLDRNKSAPASMADAGSSSLSVAVEAGRLDSPKGAEQAIFVSERKHRVNLSSPTSEQLVEFIARLMECGANEVRVFDVNMTEVMVTDVVQAGWSQQSTFRAVKVSTIAELERWITQFRAPPGRSRTYFFTDAKLLQELNTELDKVCSDPELAKLITVTTTNEPLNGVRGSVAEVCSTALERLQVTH